MYISLETIFWLLVLFGCLPAIAFLCDCIIDSVCEWCCTALTWKNIRDVILTGIFLFALMACGALIVSFGFGTVLYWVILGPCYLVLAAGVVACLHSMFRWMFPKPPSAQ